MASQDVVGEVKSRSGWAIFMGVLTAALGVFLVLFPFMTGTLTTVVLGWTLILTGIAQLIFALNSGSAGQFFWKLLSAVVYGGVGVMLVALPIQGLAALTGVLGSLFVVQSIVQGVIAFQIRPVEGWGWILFDAVVSLAIGVLILVQWPSSSAWAIGTLVGVAVFVSGVTRIMVASKIRGVSTRVEQFAHHGA